MAEKTVEEIAYTAVRDAVGDQSTRMTTLRSRATGLFSAALIVTSLLAAASLPDQSTAGGMVPDGSFQLWEIAAIVAFAVAAILTIMILLPWARWTYQIEALELIADYVDARTPGDGGQLYRDLAVQLADRYITLEKRIRVLELLFRVAAFALAFEVLAWILDLR